MKVRLKRIATYKGNPYYAGIYISIELPEAILKDPELVVAVDSNEELGKSDYNQSLTEKKIKFGASESNLTKQSHKNQPPKIIVDPPEEKSPSAKPTESTDKEEKTKVVDINTVAIDDLSILDGITASTAQKVAEERQKNLFVDFADLDKRVPLKGGRKWSSFSDRITISAS